MSYIFFEGNNVSPFATFLTSVKLPVKLANVSVDSTCKSSLIFFYVKSVWNKYINWINNTKSKKCGFPYATKSQEDYSAKFFWSKLTSNNCSQVIGFHNFSVEVVDNPARLSNVSTAVYEDVTTTRSICGASTVPYTTGVNYSF